MSTRMVADDPETGERFLLERPDLRPVFESLPGPTVQRVTPPLRPLTNYRTVYTDARTLAQEKRSQFGIVLWDRGLILAEYGGVLPGVLDSTLAEYMAVREGLLFALRHKTPQVRLYCDSSSVVGCIQEDRTHTRDSRLEEERCYVKDVLTRFEAWDVQWCPREENRRADWISGARLRYLRLKGWIK